MDRNTIIGMLLMCAVMFGYMWLNQPSEAQLAEMQRQRDSIEQADRQQANLVASGAVVDTLTALDKQQLADVLGQSVDGKAMVIDNDGVHLSMSDGRISGTIAVADTVVTFDEVASNTTANARVHNLAVAAVKRALQVYAKNGSFANCLNGTQETIKLENDSLAIELSTKGGMISRATLKAYKAFNAPRVDVFTPEDNDYSFTLSNNSQRFDTRNFFFTPERESDSTVVMRLDLGGGASWGLRYTLVPESYMVRIDMVQHGMEQVIPLNINTVDVDWHHRMMRHEEGRMFEERNSALYYKFSGKDGDVENLSETGDKDCDLKDKIKWMAAKNQFFSAVFIADEAFTGGQFTSKALENNDEGYDNYLKDLTFHTTIPYSSAKATAGTFYFYLGPNRYPLLSSYDKFSPEEDLKLTRLIPLGWALFRWINTGIIIPVFDWLGRYLTNYGIIILLLTIFIKVVLSPLTIKSYMSQAKMRVLAPEIKAINDKYPGNENAMKRQQKTFELYGLAGASPFGGCLPMLLQMPILIAMFTFFPSCIELRGQAFLWAKDLSAPDKIVEWTAQIPFITNYFGNHISLFCLLMTVTNIIYTYLSMQSQAQQQSMPGMKWMMYLMPLMFLVFFNNYASGLSYYYFISLLITIAQTYACRAFVSEEKVRATIAANRANPKKKSGFMARLEEVQRRQQEELRRQQGRAGRRH